MSPRSTERSEPVSPSKFAHVVLRTKRFPELLAWWRTLLQPATVFENDFIAFLTYDDEHHRLAIARMPGLEEPPDRSVGVDHIAYTYGSLGDLLHTYERLKSGGIEPYWCINHGPTTSMYFRDPDGNQVELQHDNFSTAQELDEFFSGGAFARNPVGVEYDPEKLLGKYQAGVPLDELVRQGSA
ncbi:MAG: VOC family protein [Deltaproteobacteria bacterium]|nr:VOC family protein [Deltaproteobacteria bacterium]MBW2413116.1 VOC family protein [Deltaproteobacteria bacterium]